MQNKKISSSIENIVNFLAQATPVDELVPADAIFLFGSVNEKNAQHVGELFKKDKAPKIIISGGIGTAKKDPSGFSSEAMYYQDILLGMGISDDFFILEEESTNSLENVLYSMEKIKELQMDVKSLILVAYPPLLRRAIATFNKQFPEINVVGSAYSPIDKDLSDPIVIKRLLREVDKFDKYFKKGDIVEVVIPEDVISDYNYLVEELKLEEFDIR
jgi:uncharacterized SAM-binding protein YcdF (DUF218 family)